MPATRDWEGVPVKLSVAQVVEALRIAKGAAANTTLVLSRLDALLREEDDRQKLLEQKAQSIAQTATAVLALSVTVGGLIIKDLAITWAWYLLAVAWCFVVISVLVLLWMALGVAAVRRYKQVSLDAVLCLPEQPARRNSDGAPASPDDSATLLQVDPDAYPRFLAAELVTVLQRNQELNDRKAAKVRLVQFWSRVVSVLLTVQMGATILVAWLRPPH